MPTVRINDDPQPGDIGYWDDDMNHFTHIDVKEIIIKLHEDEDGDHEWQIIVNGGRVVLRVGDIDVVRTIIASSQQATTRWADLLEEAGVNPTPKELSQDEEEFDVIFDDGGILQPGTQVLFQHGRRQMEGTVLDFLPAGEDLTEVLPEETPFSRIKGQRRNHNSDRYVVGVQRTATIVDFYTPTLDQTTELTEEDTQETTVDE